MSGRRSAITRAWTSGRRTRTWSSRPTPQDVLRAVNDRAITRLVVEEGEPRDGELGAEELASARARITRCRLLPIGGVADGDVRVAANAVVEGYVDTTLDPEQRAAELRTRGAGGRADEITARGDEILPSTASVSSASGKGSSRTACRSRPTGASSWTKRSPDWFDRLLPT